MAIGVAILDCSPLKIARRDAISGEIYKEFPDLTELDDNDWP